MNFYIFNSKQSWRVLLLLFVGTFILLNVLMDVALQWYVQRATQVDRFIEEKGSKAIHMGLQANAQALDIVFIGDSRTSHHISQHVFSDYNLAVYNLGVSGISILDFASLIDAAIALKPKKIAISINVGEFYSPIEETNSINWSDLQVILRTQSRSRQWVALTAFTHNMHTFNRYKTAIYLRVKQWYHRFDVKPHLEPSVSSEREEVVSTGVDWERLADCTIFDQNQTEEGRVVAKCRNGDSIIFATQKPLGKNLVEHFTDVNEYYVALLSVLLNNISQAGIQPILILEPNQEQMHYDLSMLKKRLAFDDVIDNTNFEIASDQWADYSHLNHIGRVAYSEHLAKQLQSDSQK